MVLRSLYGGELEEVSMESLEGLYQVISFLQIQEYEHALAREITTRPELLNSIDVLAFCLKNNFQRKQLSDHHVKDNLQVLSSSKNYLKLNKISPEVLNALLLLYFNKRGEQSDETINLILENYFCRNGITAGEYLHCEELAPLIGIW